VINQIKEIEKVCKRHIANTSMIKEPEGEGIKCVIDHETATKERTIRSAKIWDFDMKVTVRDSYENWEPVLKGLLGIARDLTDTKEHKWIVGDIERNSSESEYSLTLSLTVPYHPGD